MRGNIASRNKKKKKFADYVLYKELGVPIAVVEAKDNHHTVGQGLQQALDYASILNVPCGFSSNGDAFASHNKTARPPDDIETQFPLGKFPPPDVLWKRYKLHRGIKDAEEPLVLEPYYEDASGKEARYYQAEADQPGCRGGCGRSKTGFVGHGDGDWQDLHDVPNHLAAVEGGRASAGPFSLRIEPSSLTRR